jgi:hypothetical protein
MADFLSSLAGGLRAAGGVLNPSVLQANEREQIMQQQQQQRTRDLITAQILRAAEGGAIDPAQASQVLQQQGINMPSGVVGPSAETQARQQALKNEQGFRTEIDSLQDKTPESIAKVAMKYGKPEIAVGLYNAQEQRAARMQTAQEQLDFRRQQLEQQAQNAQLNREQRAELAAQAAEMRRQSIAMQAEIARGNQEFRRLGLDLQREKIDATRGQQSNRQVQQLGTALEKANIPQMVSVLDNAENVVNNKELAQYITGPKSIIPDFATSREITDARQAVEKLFNITLKDRSGAAVTNQELERLKSEFGKGIFKKPEQLQSAIVAARGIIENHYKGIAAGFGANALDEYNRNMVEMGGKPLKTGGEINSTGDGWTVKEKK